MSDSSVSDYRKEVQGFLESCEHLLASASSENLTEHYCALRG